MQTLNRTERIKLALQVLNPEVITVIDDSLAHSGHAGVSPGSSETHFKLFLVSELFENLSRIERQQKVNQLMKSEFSTGLHAVEMKLLSTKEYQSRPK